MEMEQITTYVINLKDSTRRKAYMEDVLSPCSDFLKIQYVEAVDGRKYSKEQLWAIWRQKEAFKEYGRYMIDVEIGCALSHRKCCELLLQTKEEVALILEDDLVWQDADVKGIVTAAAQTMKSYTPMVILLSGDYWFTTKREVGKSGLCLANVREAVCTQAYLVNRAAAQLMVSAERKFLADDWFNIKKQGIRLYGCYPHIADQNRRDFATEISEDYAGVKRENMSFGHRLYSYYRAIVKRILVHTGHFESKHFLLKDGCKC